MPPFHILLTPLHWAAMMCSLTAIDNPAPDLNLDGKLALVPM